jgi:hypothetical protein
MGCYLTRTREYTGKRQGITCITNYKKAFNISNLRQILKKIRVLSFLVEKFSFFLLTEIDNM